MAPASLSMKGEGHRRTKDRQIFINHWPSYPLTVLLRFRSTSVHRYQVDQEISGVHLQILAHEALQGRQRKHFAAERAYPFARAGMSQSFKICIWGCNRSMGRQRRTHAGFLRRTDTRTATFILLNAHRGLVTLVGEETTQGQHTDLPAM